MTHMIMKYIANTKYLARTIPLIVGQYLTWTIPKKIGKYLAQTNAMKIGKYPTYIAITVCMDTYQLEWNTEQLLPYISLRNLNAYFK